MRRDWSSSPQRPMGSPTAFHPYACVRCASRKVRCNKQEPCEACRRHNVPCTYRPIKPGRERPVQVDTQALLRRLKHCEELLKQNGISTEGDKTAAEAAKSPPGFSASSTNMAKALSQTFFKPSVVTDKKGTKLIDNNLWSRVGEEVDTTEELSDPDQKTDEDAIELDNDEASRMSYFRQSASTVKHPPTWIAQRLWQLYLERVNPIMHITHIPTLEPVILDSIQGSTKADRRLTALMFAIYSTAVLSLTNKECLSIFDNSKSVMLKKYAAMTTTALTRANFMATSSIQVLQALVLHIISIRDCTEPRAVWTLTGLAIRVAEGMGLQYDGTVLELSAFDTEMRSRIWWQLKMHDLRTRELCGQPKIRAFEFEASSPRLPSNIEDQDIWPGMVLKPKESDRPTEMVWCMLRFELVAFSAAQKAKMQARSGHAATSEDYTADDDIERKDIFIGKLQDVLESKILRFCDPSKPLHFLTLVGARLSMNLVRFLAHHPRRWTKLKNIPESEKRLVWNVCMDLLVQYNLIQTNDQLAQFAWNISYFIQWHAAIYVLDNLRTSVRGHESAKAWSMIDALYENNAELLLCMDRPIFVALGNLCLKAVEASQRDPASCPAYIAKLKILRQPRRGNRPVTKMQTPAWSDTTAIQEQTSFSEPLGRGHSVLSATDVNMTQGSVAPTASTEMAQMPSVPNDSSDWFALNQIPALPEVIPFSFAEIDNFECGLLPGSVDADVDWNQWDHWLTGLDFDHPNTGMMMQ